LRIIVTGSGMDEQTMSIRSMIRSARITATAMIECRAGDGRVLAAFELTP
jgi:hypothetical protein